jgi:hypothetical protein
MVISNINHPSFACQGAVMQRMLAEANYFSDRLKLPTSHPIFFLPAPCRCATACHAAQATARRQTSQPKQQDTGEHVATECCH